MSVFMSETELAARWEVSPKTLQRWRTEKRGPPYLKLSKSVRYRREDIDAYEVSERKIAQAEVIPPPPADAKADIPKMTLAEALHRFIKGTRSLSRQDAIAALAARAELGQCRSRRPHPDTRQAFRLHHLQML